MIWADRIAIALAVLVAFAFGIAFVSSDAALRMETLRAREAKLEAACAQQTAPAADASAPVQTDAAPDGAVAETAAPTPKADAASQPEASAADVQAVNPLDAPRETSPEVGALPGRICTDDKVQTEIESEEGAITVPTARGTAIEIAEAELFGVLPVWVGLRIFDIKSDGPRRRLARSAYWRATEDARRARRRERRKRTERMEAGE